MKQAIFLGSYLYLPFLILCLFVLWRKSGAIRGLTVFALFAASVLAYARFIEPRILTVEHSDITLSGATNDTSTIKLALFSDTHFGVYKNAMPMQRIVSRINTEAPDVVLIAGDFLYHLAPAEIPASLAPLADLKGPVFAVLGNHDVGFPGPVYTADLYSALNALGVTLVENRAHRVTLAGQDVIIAGTSDLWQRQQDYGFAADMPDLPVFLLTHNPDTALSVPADFGYDLMLAGHTHGGQVRLPGLVQRFIPTEYPFDKGLHEVTIAGERRHVFVTSGTGMVGLPFRFNMPPRIDILTISLPAGN